MDKNEKQKRHLNQSERYALRVAELARHVKAVDRKAQKDTEPNDRRRSMMHLTIALIRFVCHHPTPTEAARWCLRLATRALTGSLNVPEALVVHTGAFAVAYVGAVERRATLVCPMKLWRDLTKEPSARGGHQR
jgi:hypothetical protein